MKIKQIKNILIGCMLVVSSVAGSIAFSTTTNAIKCSGNLEYRAGDNGCWEKVTKPGCSGRCTTTDYVRTNQAPINDDGSAISFTCPSGQEYHNTDNKCYKVTNKPCNGGRSTCKDYEEGGTPTANPASVTPGANCGSTSSGSTTNSVASTQACKNQAAAESICGTVTSGSNANTASKITDCQNGVKQCLVNNPNDAAAAKACADAVPGANTAKTAAATQAASTSTPVAGTGANGGSQGTGKCGDARTNIIDCGSAAGGTPAIAAFLKIILFVLTILIGIVAVGGIVYAAILYASAEDNAGRVSQAKGIIRDVAIGLVLYALMVAIVNWLVPGGVIG